MRFCTTVPQGESEVVGSTDRGCEDTCGRRENQHVKTVFVSLLRDLPPLFKGSLSLDAFVAIELISLAWVY